MILQHWFSHLKFHSQHKPQTSGQRDRVSSWRSPHLRRASLELLEDRTLLSGGFPEGEFYEIDTEDNLAPPQILFGGSILTVTGHVDTNDIDRYSFLAVEGQEIQLELKPEEPNVTLMSEIGASVIAGNEVSHLTEQLFHSKTTPSGESTFELTAVATDSSTGRTASTSVEIQQQFWSLPNELRGTLSILGWSTEANYENSIHLGSAYLSAGSYFEEANYFGPHAHGFQEFNLNETGFASYSFTLPDFVPVLDLYNPQGELVATAQGYADFTTTVDASFSYIADKTGTWTVKVSHNEPDFDVASRPYTLTAKRMGDVPYFLDGVDHHWFEHYVEPQIGTLQVTTNNGGDVSIGSHSLTGKITIDGDPIDTRASSLSNIEVTGDSQANTIDVSGVQPDAFSMYLNITLDGGDGDDRIVGAPFSTTVLGGSGDDTFVMMADDDITATDTQVYIESASQMWTELSGINTIELHGGESSNYLDADTSSAVKAKLFGYGSYDYLYGGEGDDVLDGGEGSDNLNGGLGADTLIGGAGNDALRANGTNSPADGAADYADGGEGHDTITWSEGDRYTTLIGGEGYDDLRIRGPASVLDISPDLQTINPPTLLVDRDGDVGSASGFEEIRIELVDNTLPPDVPAAKRTVRVQGLVDVPDVYIRTDSGDDEIEVWGTDFDSNNAFLRIVGGAGNDKITLHSPDVVGDELAVGVFGGEGDDDIFLHSTDLTSGAVVVDVKGQQGGDTLTVYGTNDADEVEGVVQGDEIYLTQLNVDPGQYNPNLEDNPGSLVRRPDNIYIHSGKFVVEVDMDPGDATEEITVEGRAGNDLIAGRVDSLEPTVVLDKLTVNGGTGDDTIDMSAMAGAVPTMLLVNGNEGDDTLFGRGVNDVLDGGVDTDDCSGGAEHQNCENGPAVTAKWDDDADASRFGTFLQDVTLNNIFTVTYEDLTSAELAEITQVSYEILVDGTAGNAVTGNAQRVGQTNQWQFTFNVGLLRTAAGGVAVDRGLTVFTHYASSQETGFEGTLGVIKSIELDVDVRGVSAANKGVGDFVEIDTVRLLEGVPGFLEYRVNAIGLPLVNAGPAGQTNPYRDSLELVSRNLIDGTYSTLQDLHFGDEDPQTDDGTLAYFQETLFGTYFNTTVNPFTNGGFFNHDYFLFLAPRTTDLESPELLSNGEGVLVVATPSWVGDNATGIDRTLLTTADETDNASRLKQAFDSDNFGGYVVDANLDIPTEGFIANLVNSFIPVQEAKHFLDALNTLTDTTTSVTLLSTITIYAKLSTAAGDAKVGADQFQIIVKVLDNDVLDETVSLGKLEVTANLNPVTLELQATQFEIFTKTPQTIANNVKIIDTPLGSLGLPTPIPWVTASLSGSLSAHVDKITMEARVGIDIGSNGITLNEEKTFVEIVTQASGQATGAATLKATILGFVDLVGVTATLTANANLDATIRVNYSSTEESSIVAAKLNEKKTKANFSADYDLDWDVFTIKDWIEEKIDTLEETIDDYSDKINKLTKTSGDITAGEIPAAKDYLPEKYLVFGSVLGVPGFEEDPDNTLEGKGLPAAPSYGEIVPTSGNSFPLLGLDGTESPMPPGLQADSFSFFSEPIAVFSLGTPIIQALPSLKFDLNVISDTQPISPGFHTLQTVLVDGTSEIIINTKDLADYALNPGNVPLGYLSGWQTLEIEIPVGLLDPASEYQLEFRLVSAEGGPAETVGVALDSLVLGTTKPQLVVSTPVGSLDDGVLDFGIDTVDPAQAVLLFENHGNDELRIDSFEIIGEGFEILALPNEAVTIQQPPNDWLLTIDVTNSVQPAEAILRVTSNDPAQNVIDIPLSFSGLPGGDPQISLTDNSAAIADASVQFTTPLSQYRSGAADSNLVRPSSADQTHYIDITNTGSGPLTLFQITINAQDVFTDVPLTAAAGDDITIAAGETQRIHLTFAPLLPNLSDFSSYNFAMPDGLVIHSDATNAPLLHVALSGQSTFNSDINYDGAVNFGDLGILNVNFGLTDADPNWDPNADINGDGSVNFGDLGQFNAEFGQTLQPTATIAATDVATKSLTATADPSTVAYIPPTQIPDTLLTDSGNERTTEAAKLLAPVEDSTTMFPKDPQPTFTDYETVFEELGGGSEEDSIAHLFDFNNALDEDLALV